MRKITVSEIAKLLNCKIINFAGDTEVENGYCGDFLSFVISRVPDKAVWITVMNNANVAAVAKLGEIPVIVICENVKADSRLAECCKNEGLNLLETPLNAFECAQRLGGN